jgi:hypothetical protein
MKKQRKWTAEEQKRIDLLATYNAEVARGIVHTYKWKREMEDLQAWFNNAVLRENRP